MMPPEPLSLSPSLSSLVEEFCALFETTGPTKFIFPLTWTLNDIILLDLLSRHTNVTPHVVFLDSLYLFPETLQYGQEISQKFQLHPEVFKPLNCETQEDFEKLHSHPSSMPFHQYDELCNKDPLKRVVRKYSNYTFLFSRSNNSTSPRKLHPTDLQNRVFHPLAEWKWIDLTAYALEASLPLHPFYYQLLKSPHFVPKDTRVGYSQWEVQMMKVPSFSLPPEAYQGTYRWKYIGDIFTSIPVHSKETEFSGKFQALKSVSLTERQKCDVELLLTGAFSPLEGFMTQSCYTKVLKSFRLLDDSLWGIPTILDVSEDFQVGEYVRLVEAEEGKVIAIMRVDSKWIPDRLEEAKAVYGFTAPDHPAVFHLLHERNKYYIGGPLYGLDLPKRDWVTCFPPLTISHLYSDDSLVAFQCRNPIHRAHAAMFSHVNFKLKSRVIVHPIVGPTKADDFSAPVRKLTYEALKKLIPQVDFQYLPYNMMVGGPRECLQHLLIRKNYTFTHMIVGRDHAGCKNAKGEDFYGPYDSQDFVKQFVDELGIQILPFQHMVYIPEKETYETVEEAQTHGWVTQNISGSEFRRKIVAGEDIPEWFAFPQVVEILKKHYGPSSAQSILS